MWIPFLKINFNSPEGPIELLLRTSTGGDIDGQEELLEVDVAVVIRVEGPKDVIAELIGVARRKTFAVDVHEGFGGEATVRAVTHETAVPFLIKNNPHDITNSNERERELLFNFMT